MLFQNEKPRHITLIKNDKYPRSFQILENYKEANNNEENVYKSINFNRKSRLKPLNHNYNLNDNEGEKIVLPKIGTRSSVKEIKIISNNILEETEKEIKKRIKHSNRQKNIKIKINIENININNTVIFKEEEKIIKDNLTIDNTKFINTANRLNNKRSIFQMINQLMINHNYKKVLMFLKANNIETCNLKFINTILNFKITQNKKSFDKMFKLLKFFVFITLKLSKRNFFKMLKKNKETYDLKRESCVVHIQKIFKGFYFRKNNKHLNEKNKAIKNSIIKIQKHLRGVFSRNRNQDYLKSFKEFKRIQQMKKDYLIQRKVVLKQSAAIRVIEEFWLAILERRDDEKLEQQIANMPEECRNLYIKFVNLRKQTNNLKKDLVKIGMKK